MKIVKKTGFYALMIILGKILRQILIFDHSLLKCSSKCDWHSRTTKVGISEKRRRDSRIIMLYKGLKGAVSISMNDLVPPIRHVRNHHFLAFQTVTSLD